MIYNFRVTLEYLNSPLARALGALFQYSYGDTLKSFKARREAFRGAGSRSPQTGWWLSGFEEKEPLNARFSGWYRFHRHGTLPRRGSHVLG